jgi:hypothetical protein
VEKEGSCSGGEAEMSRRRPPVSHTKAGKRRCLVAGHRHRPAQRLLRVDEDIPQLAHAGAAAAFTRPPALLPGLRPILPPLPAARGPVPPNARRRGDRRVRPVRDLPFQAPGEVSAPVGKVEVEAPVGKVEVEPPSMARTKEERG